MKTTVNTGIEEQMINFWKSIDSFSIKLSKKYAKPMELGFESLKTELQDKASQFVLRLVQKGYCFDKDIKTMLSKTFKFMIDTIELKQLEFVRVVPINQSNEALQIAYDYSVEYARFEFFERLESLSNETKSLINFIFNLTDEQIEKLMKSNDKKSLIIASIIKRQIKSKKKKSNPKTLLFAFSELHNFLYKFDHEYENFCMKLKPSKARKSMVCNNEKPIRNDKDFRVYKPKNESLYPIADTTLKHEFDLKTGKYLFSYFEYLQGFQSNTCKVDKSKKHTTKTDKKMLLLSELFDCQKHCYKPEKLTYRAKKEFGF